MSTTKGFGARFLKSKSPTPFSPKMRRLIAHRNVKVAGYNEWINKALVYLDD
jgi:hypothetical protein